MNTNVRDVGMSFASQYIQHISCLVIDALEIWPSGLRRHSRKVKAPHGVRRFESYYFLDETWRCGREVDGVVLERRRARKGSTGSNPVVSSRESIVTDVHW
jgi:hypothetical protein